MLSEKHSTYIITLVDGINLGLIQTTIYSFLIVFLGSSHTVTGFFSFSQTVCKVYASYLGYTISNQESISIKIIKGLIIFTSLVELLCHCIVGKLNSDLPIIIFRCIFCFANSMNTAMWQTFINHNQADEDERQKTNVLVRTISFLGFLIGAFASGHIYNQNCLSCIMKTATAFAAVKITISLLFLLSDITLLNIAEQKNVVSNSIYLHQPGTIVEKRGYIMLAVRSLTFISIVTYFKYYPALLVASFEMNTTLLGYMVAYQSLLLYLSGIIIKRYVQIQKFMDSIRYTFVVSLCCLLFTTYVLCTTTSYVTYMLMVIPLVFARSLLENVYDNVCYMTDMKNLIDKTLTFLEFFVTLAFGIATDCWCITAFNVATIGPLVLSLLLALFL